MSVAAECAADKWPKGQSCGGRQQTQQPNGGASHCVRIGGRETPELNQIDSTESLQ